MCIMKFAVITDYVGVLHVLLITSLSLFFVDFQWFAQVSSRCVSVIVACAHYIVSPFVMLI